jgi:glycosyltransferase involved in cell wall biosynthesis
MIKCHVGTAKQLLDDEYRRLGLPPGHAITDARVDIEIESLKLYDYVFCSNPLVEKSVINYGVADTKVRSTSFGWSPERFRGEGRALPPIDGVTFLFVGLICIRKGAHLLMRYWSRSGIRGRLVLVGQLERAVAQVSQEYMRRGDVKIIGHTTGIGDYYRAADVFAFPTIEEGGPQVTYEAAGCGLPLIVSPMGAARLADKSTGYVLDPHDEEGWIEAMRALAKHVEQRRAMGSTAKRKADEFTWTAVSRVRGDYFRELAESLGKPRLTGAIGPVSA